MGVETKFTIGPFEVEMFRREAHLQNVLLVSLRYWADGDGGELGFLLVHNVRRNVGGLAYEEFQAFIHLKVN